MAKKGSAVTGSAKKGQLSTAEARREYQRRYYQAHKERAKEYQRRYNLSHKKKRVYGLNRKANFVCPREARQTVFNMCDFQNAHGDKAVKMIRQIVSGERLFTM